MCVGVHWQPEDNFAGLVFLSTCTWAQAVRLVWQSTIYYSMSLSPVYAIFYTELNYPNANYMQAASYT